MVYAKGADISAWQGTPNWDVVATAGLSFIMIKVTEGTGYLAKYQQQWEGAKRAGLLRSPYMFHRYKAGGIAQADFFMKNAQKGELPPMVDFEDIEALRLPEVTGAQILEDVRKTLERIESVWETLPILYTGDWFLTECLAESPTYNARWLTKYPLFIASYKYDPNIAPKCPAWWPWKFYQYSNVGKVPGVSGNVDLDVFNGTVDDLYAYAGIEKCAPTDAQKLAILWNDYIARGGVIK